MRVRGRRECAACGNQWSYYETGAVTCPSCGAVESVGVDERRRHTDRDATLDLDAIRRDLDDRPLEALAAEAATAARRYLAARGFFHAGSLRPLDDAYVTAAELRHVADEIRLSLATSEDVAAYFRELVRSAADGERPSDVPAASRGVRGRGIADAVGDYRRALSTWLDDHPEDATRSALGRLRDHTARLDALDGDIPFEDAERVLEAARALGEYLAAGDEGALGRATAALDALE